jgi:putative two-component system response regulator
MPKYASDPLSKDTYDLIRRMAILAELRDPGIANHIDRVRSYCRLLAAAIELSPYEAELIASACMLHDVGKAGIPQEILEKTGTLNDYEWERIKEHTLAGADLLRGSPSVYLQTGEIIALTHHERWDGSGYPRGLKGEEIPLSGRICAVADVFDALTTWRPYKHEIPVDEALALIGDSAGTLFDPALVRAFVVNAAELIRIRTQYS